MACLQPPAQLFSGQIHQIYTDFVISLPTYNGAIGPFQGHPILPNRVDHQSWSISLLIFEISKISLCQLVLSNCYLLPPWPLVLWCVRVLSHCAWNVFFFHRITLPKVSTTIFQWKLVKYNISLPTHNTLIGPFQGHRILPNRVDHQSWSISLLIFEISNISLCQLVLPNCYLLPPWPLVLWCVSVLSNFAQNVFSKRFYNNISMKNMKIEHFATHS